MCVVKFSNTLTMKKTFLFAIMFIALVSCSKNSSSEAEEKEAKQSNTTKSTEELVNFFNSYIVRLKDANDIVIDEMFHDREKRFSQWMDSVVMFNNLKGYISDIKLDDSYVGSSKILSYQITIPIEEKTFITLICRNTIEKDSIPTDYFCEKMKKMSDSTTIFFNGFFPIYGNKTVASRDNTSHKKGGAIFFPFYYFYLVDISTSELTDSITPNLKHALRLGQKECEHIAKKWKRQKTSAADYHKLWSGLKDVKSSLSPQEQVYYKRYTDAFTEDLIKYKK